MAQARSLMARCSSAVVASACSRMARSSSAVVALARSRIARSSSAVVVVASARSGRLEARSSAVVVGGPACWLAQAKDGSILELGEDLGSLMGG